MPTVKHKCPDTGKMKECSEILEKEADEVRNWTWIKCV